MGEQINDNAEIIPFSIGFDIGKVVTPYDIGSTLRELMFQVVSAVSVIILAFVESGFVR